MCSSTGGSGGAVSGDTEGLPCKPIPPRRPVVLVGLMGAGKTSVGRRLARKLRVPFTDADDAIVAAAGLSIPDIFELYGEQRFRDLERRVVARLLEDGPGVLALGGGAFVDPATRARCKERGLTIWLRAGLDTLVTRVERKPRSRPLLAGAEPRAILARLLLEREAAYGEAELVIDSDAAPVERVVERILARLDDREDGTA
jgi:shikimate kinase